MILLSQALVLGFDGQWLDYSPTNILTRNEIESKKPLVVCSQCLYRDGGSNTVPFRSLLANSILEGDKPLVIRLRATHRYCIEARNCGRGRCKLEARDHTNRHEDIRVGSSQNNRHRCPRRKTCHINTIRIDVM